MILGNELGKILILTSICSPEEQPLSRDEFYFLNESFNNAGLDFMENACTLALTLSVEDFNKKTFYSKYYSLFTGWLEDKNFNELILLTNLLDRFYNDDSSELSLRTPETLNKRKNIEYIKVFENVLKFNSLEQLAKSKQNREQFFNKIKEIKNEK